MSGNRFVAHASGWRALLTLFIAVAFVVMGIVFASDPAGGVGRRYGPVMYLIVGWASILFSVPCAIFAIGEFFRPEPVMEIGPEGVRWRRWSDEMIPWAAFERAALMEIRHQRSVTLWLRTPDAYVAKRLLRRSAASKALGYGDMTLSAAGLDHGFDEMAAAVLRHAPHLFADRV